MCWTDAVASLGLEGGAEYVGGEWRRCSCDFPNELRGETFRPDGLSWIGQISRSFGSTATSLSVGCMVAYGIPCIASHHIALHRIVQNWNVTCYITVRTLA